MLTKEEITEILSDEKSQKYIHQSGKEKNEFLDSVMKVKDEGFAFEDEEYLKGIRALAIPLRLNRKNFQCAIWAVGLKNQIKETSLKSYIDFLKEIANKIESKF